MAYNRKQRLNDNIKAIETAFILDREQRTPTARERLLLERYCGFGGLKCILNPARELDGILHAVSRYGGSDGCVERASDYPRKGA